VNSQKSNTVLQAFEKACTYNHKGEKTISGSQLGKDTLQIYLNLKYPNRDTEAFKVTQASLGSIFHLGMEKAIEMMNEGHKTEVEVSMPLMAGWMLTGTVDMIEFVDGEPVLHDYKLTKIYKGKMLRKEFANFVTTDAYALQLNAYSVMFDEEKHRARKTKMILDMFYKDANELKGENAYEPIDVPFMSATDIIVLANEKVMELEKYLNSDSVPPECEDKWIRKTRTGEVIKTRCELYCDVKNVCPYYNNHGKSTLEKVGWGF